jgi:hypothetical protein
MNVFAFACRHKDSTHETVINDVSAAKAKYRYFLDVREPWPDVKFIDFRVRKIGAAHTSERFKANALYRGMPDVRCGDRVTVGQDEGVIVGHNSSANFDVLFTSGRWKGITLNVHPQEVKLAPVPKWDVLPKS